MKIKVSGDPVATAACNCTNCQKRTGSVFGVGAYFKSNQIISILGDSKLFSNVGESGKGISRFFCPNCGSTLYWEAEFQPGFIGVAVGCFTDPNFPEPTVSCWNQSKYKWVKFPSHWNEFLKQE